MHEELDVDAFRRAWNEIVKRHPVFRTRFKWRPAGDPVQEVYADVDVPFAGEDWSDVSAELQTKRLEAYLRADRKKGFDVDQAPLMRLAIFRHGPAAYVWVWTSHHALLDGRSRLLVLKASVSEACRSKSSPRSCPSGCPLSI